MASGRTGRHQGLRDRAIIELRSTKWSPELGGRVAMEAGPRNTAQGAQYETAKTGEQQALEGYRPSRDSGSLSSDGPDEQPPGGVTDDGPEPDEMSAGPEVEVELRPQRRLRMWQLAPIVALAALGSLMFAFPLAFEFGDGGAVVAMLGLLICSCAAGWGMMAARRVGSTWPGLPQRGSGRRPDWRVVLGYVVMVLAVVALAVWRVARLR